MPKLIARALAVKPTPVHREQAHDPATDEHAIEITRHHQVVEAEKDHHAQMLLQFQRIHLPRGHREADALVQELLDYEIRVDDKANEKYGAFRVGTHDDLVTALGLAVQKEPSVSVYPGNVYYGL